MTPVAEIVSKEIAQGGPVSFHRFMELALYHPQHGYYRRGKDPFGKRGDFYTAEQVQPAFGLLIASAAGALRKEMGCPEDFAVVELGAGRGEMAEHLREFRYLAVEVDDELPARFCGVLLANEFFDALPVHAAVKRGGDFREMRVGIASGGFCWVEGASVGSEVRDFLECYAGDAGEGALVEANLEALRWIEEIGARLENGYLLVIDYGYTARELVRFPFGTLMSYRGHAASEEVLADPGERDITAHVHFTALERHAAANGFKTIRFESLASLLMRAGEEDQFRQALAASTEAERARRRLQLKTLLFGMGESFRALLMSKGAAGTQQKRPR